MSDPTPPSTTSGAVPDPIPSSSTSQRPRQGNGRRRTGGNNIISSNPITYEGSDPTLGYVLAMRVEKFHKKLPFHQFTEKAYYHMVATVKDGADLYPLFKELKDPQSDLLKNNMPVKPDLDEDEEDSVVETETAIYNEEIKQFVQRKLNLRRNMQKSYALIWGQCSTQLQEYVKGQSEYTKHSATSNVVWLLKELKKATSGVDSKANGWMNMQDAIAALYRMKQGPSESNEHYMERFKANITAIELTKGDHIFYSPGMTGKERGDHNKESILEEEERNKALLLLRNSDDNRYKGLMDELRKSALLERDEYPTTIADMYEVMMKYDQRSNQSSFSRNNTQRRSGTALVQQAEGDTNGDTQTLIPGSDGRSFNVKCYNCDRMGHYASNCPEPSRRSGFNNLLFGQIHTQNKDNSNVIPNDWILLDSCSTDCVFKDPSIITNISKCSKEKELKMRTNGGSIVYKHTGYFTYLPLQVYYNNSSIANILSLKHVMDIPGVSVTIDNSTEPTIILSYEGKDVRFSSTGGGLFHCSIKDLHPLSPSKSVTTSTTPNKGPDTTTSCLATVRMNESKYTKKDRQGAIDARNLQRDLMWPSSEALIKYIEGNYIQGCNITRADIIRAEQIYGPPLAELKGKMTHPKQIKDSTTQFPLPTLNKDILNIKLYVDIFYVNGIPFLHTKSKDLDYITVQHLKSRKEKEISSKLGIVVDRYIKRGFVISDVFGDNEFNHPIFERLVLPANMHICAKGEHVPVVERSIRTIKERARSVFQDLPYDRIPKIMIISLLERITRVLNTFPSNSSKIQQSPALLVEGRGPLNYKVPRVPFGSYAIIHAGTDNTLNTRGIPAIALRNSNESTGHYFMSLATGKRLNSNKWTSVPLPDHAIASVEEMAKSEPKNPSYDEEEPYNLFEEGEFVHEDSEDDDLSSENIDTSHQEVQNIIHEYSHSTTTTDTEVGADEPEIPQPMIQGPPIAVEAGINQSAISDVDSTMFEFNVNNAYLSSPTPNTVENSTDEQNEDSSDDESTNNSAGDMSVEDESELTSESDLDVPITQLAERLRAEQDPNEDTDPAQDSSSDESDSNHGSIFLSKDDQRDQGSFHRVVNHVFTQMSATQGIKKHGEKAIAAIFKELKQLNEGAMPGKPVITPIPFESLTEQDRSQALEAVNLIKEKRCGKLKGRTCANGSRQRNFLKDGEDFASPTASLESILTTLVIDAWEGRDVAVADVPGAYLHASFPEDKKVILKLQGVFVDIMCDVNPDFKPHIVFEKNRKGKPVKCLYMRVLRALYGCIESALLWYELYSSTLMKLGFKINPYDRCVANKQINGSQCTVVFYVDDNKISHKDPAVVTSVLDEISAHFGDLTITRGTKHDFLGMNIELKEGKVHIDMKEQVAEAIEWGKSQGGCKPANPASVNLFHKADESAKLSSEDADKFHSIVQKLLYICKRARPDIEPAVSFLCTRVTDPSKDDSNKLTRVLGFLERTINDKRILGANSLSNLLTWIDASYAPHDDMRSHTGGGMSLGHGTIHTKSSKQKLNTKSSTEAELVGMSDYLPYNIWMTNFLHEQGYPLSSNVIFQDNQSAIKMEINGRNSCTGNSRHIDIRYFFVKDRIDQGNLTVEYCPTEQMLADFFTKPLQGSTFQKFRAQIMGHTPLELPTKSSHKRETKERVELSRNLTSQRK